MRHFAFIGALLLLSGALQFATANNGLRNASRFGDDGDLLMGEDWNPSWMRTMCVPVPRRTDSSQEVPAANLFVRTYGRLVPGQPSWVLNHGTSASENYWDGVARLLSRWYFVVSISLRGHFKSQITLAVTPSNATYPFRYTYEVFADDTKVVIDSLNLASYGPIYYAGISIGSSIGIQLAATYPYLIDRLVLVSGAPLFRCADLSTDGSVPTCAPSVPGGHVPWLTGLATTPITMFPEDVLSGCNVTNARDKVNQNRAYSGVAVTSLVRYAQTIDQTPLLSKIKCPTLIAAGLGDGTNGIEAAEALHKGIVNSVRADFVNRGHLFPVTCYMDLFNRMISFVNSHSLPEITRILDTGCQIAEAVAPEADTTPCPNIC